MTSHSTDKARPITIAIMAIGGQGGGVLADWIVELAGANGYLAQSTSVPGVAQRTGATIYYLELFPESAAAPSGRTPVMALMPVSGDVDIVIAAELMEAGRAMLRGFVTPERTTLIASSHRIFGILEKSAMSDGRANHEKVQARAAEQAKRFLAFDMAALADATGAAISAVLFGALAGSGVLPFSRAAFEATIRDGGRAVEVNLAGFAAGFAGCATANTTPAKSHSPAEGQLGEATTEKGRALVERLRAEVPAPAQSLAFEGIKRLVDYQDYEYAGEYLDKLQFFADLERLVGGEAKQFRLTTLFARHLALWMSYEDTIRVADLKTRGSRFERVRQEVRAADDQVVYITEFMHPRYQEICETLPAGVGEWLLNSPTMARLTAPLFREGRRISTAKLGGFTLLSTLAGMRRFRRGTLRHSVETERMARWIKRIEQVALRDYDVAGELIECQRLVKGYSDTHARGVANFDRIMSAVDRRGAGMMATDVKRLRDAALADERGDKLALELDLLGNLAAGDG